MHRFDSDKIKRELPIEMLIGKYNLGGNLKKRGTKLRGPCPVHGGDSPTAFNVDLDLNVWNCFTREHGGSVLDLIMQVEGCDFFKALEIGDSFLNHGYIPEHYKILTVKKEKKKSGNKPLSFRLSLDPWHPYFAERGIKAETAKKFGTGYLCTGKYAGTICFPISNYNGDIVAYSRRITNDEEIVEDNPRYKVFPYNCEKAEFLYNISRVKNYDCSDIIVVEGFFDIMKLYQFGYINVVSLLTAHMSVKQAEMLVSQKKRVILMLDGDKAGIQGTDHALEILRGKVDVKAINLPDRVQPDNIGKHDIDQLISKYRYEL